MKTFLAIALTMISLAASAQNVQYAAIVSITPITEQVVTIKQQCGASAGYHRQEPSIGNELIGAGIGGFFGQMLGHGNGKNVGMVVGAAAGAYAGSEVSREQQYQPACRSIQTYITMPGALHE